MLRAILRAKRSIVINTLRAERPLETMVSGEPPFYWGLKHSMPAWFFDICASLRAA